MTKKHEDHLEEQVASEEDITAAAGEGEDAEVSEVASLSPEEAAALIQALEDARKEVEESQQRLLRAQADFDNFRRRTRTEKEELAQYASIQLLEQLLPVVDNFNRAMESSRAATDLEAVVKGLDMVQRQLTQVLEQEGLRTMEVVGQPFNPEFHQAVMQVESDEYEEGFVVEEVLAGYMVKDRILRPAMVKVSM